MKTKIYQSRAFTLLITLVFMCRCYGQSNTPPISDAFFTSTRMGEPVTFNVLSTSTDPDGKATTFGYIWPYILPFTTTGNGTGIFYPTTSGLDSFNYVVCDSSIYPNNIECDTNTVYINVLYPYDTLVNHAPIANTDFIVGLKEHSMLINTESNDLDVDNDKITLPYVMATPINGTITVNTNGYISYTPLPGFIGSDSFQYVICDTLALYNPKPMCDSAWAILFITDSINSNNLPPIAVDDNILGYDNTPLIINVLKNDFEPNGNMLISPIISNSATHGVTTVNADKTLTYHATVGYLGNDSLQYVVCDTLSAQSPLQLCDTATVRIVIDTTRFNVQDSISQVTCNGGGNGSINITVNGGLWPFTYLWSNSQNVEDLQNLVAGSYYITITDAIGRTLTRGYIVSEPLLLTATISFKKDISCFGGLDGMAVVQAQGGISSYTYQWGSPPQSTDTASNLSTGTYAVTVTDANNCTVTASATITQPPMLVFNAGADQTICKGTNTMIGNNLGASGGTPVYNYTWSNTGLGPYIPEQNEGLYIITVTDMNGCVALDSVGITVVDFQDSIVSPFSDTLTCGTQSLLQFQQANATAVVTNWDFADGGQSAVPSPQHTFITQGIYAVSLISINNIGCSDTSFRTVSFGQDCVFPGDANYDGIVNNNDLLAIGLAYDSIGPVRANQSLVWAPSYADDWSDTTTWNINRKHADCNGNGIVNANDTVAIMQNWGSTHSKANEQRPFRASIPSLQIALSPNPALNGDTIIASILLGDININVNNVYGIAFTFNYTNLVVDSTKTIIEFGPSWLGTVVDKMSIAKDFPQQGEIKAAITRIDHTNRSGFGEIGKVKLVINTDNIDGKTYATFPFEAYITALEAVDAHGKPIDLNEGADTTYVSYVPNAIAAITENRSFSVYPNPANNVLFIESNLNVSADFKLLNTIGETVQEWTNVKSAKMNVLDLPTGLYCIDAHYPNGQQIRKRIVIAR